MDVKYESEKLSFTQPAKKRRYIPDFVISLQKNAGTPGKVPKQDKIYIETKGKFTADDRHKMQMVLTQNPDVNLTIVFQNANKKIHKLSKTTYGDWCTKHNIKWLHWPDIQRGTYTHDVI